MPAVRLKNVSKCYWVYDSPFQSLVGMVAPKMAVPEEVWALRDIDLEVEQGECIGIIGNNGSGKSTLLSVVGGIITPTEGEIAVEGRISTLLDLTVGMQPELTGRANIKVIGGLLGMSDEEIERRAPSIIAFADLKEALNRPVKTYSTGMRMRLGFSIALYTDFDVFLVDEVLAVGDSNFHRKCIAHLRDLHVNKKRTILVASHGLGEIGSLTDRLLLLSEGRIIRQGKTEDVLAAYWQECERERNQVGHRVPALQQVKAYGDDLGDVKIDGVRFLDAKGHDNSEFMTGQPLTVEIWFNARVPVKNPLFRIQIFRNDGVWVHGMNSYRHDCDLGLVEGRGCVRLAYASVNLLHGDYRVSVGVWPDEYTSFMTDVAYDVHDKAYLFRVVSERTHGAGIVMQPATWSILAPAEAETQALERALIERGRLPERKEGPGDAGDGGPTDEAVPGSADAGEAEHGP